MYATRRRGLFFACLTVGALLTGCASTSELGSSSVEQATSLPNSTQLSKALNSVLEHTGVPGAAALITGSDGVESLALYGEASPGIPTSKDTRFAYRSVTKSFVGTIILQLADEGKLSLDAPVLISSAAFPGVKRSLSLS